MYYKKRNVGTLKSFWDRKRNNLNYKMNNQKFTDHVRAHK